jgi:hypothetical protein
MELELTPWAHKIVGIIARNVNHDAKDAERRKETAVFQPFSPA